MDKKNIKIYKCFIASPSDTKKERHICDKVFNEINNTIGEAFDFRVESVKWEEDTIPNFGKAPQQIINEQLLNNFQLFIGIMFTKFGTPTNNANSGTEEEFYLAYDKLEKGDDIKIMFYFNDEAVKPSKVDNNQSQKVKDFKVLISDKGLHSKYEGDNDFEEKLRKHLLKFFSEKQNGGIKNNYFDVSAILQDKLNDSLSIFPNQPNVWVEPELFEENEKNDAKIKIKITDIVNNPHSVVIDAPPQFGMTCLARYLVIEAWKKGGLWIYLDMNIVNIHIDINKIIKKELRGLGLENKTVDCIILDSWTHSATGSMKVLRGICNTHYQDTPLIVMHTAENFGFPEKEEIKINREFKRLTLSALPRNAIRKVVSEYNSERNIGDENTVLSKVISDMEVLNIHRTPLNCITLLKISEKHFDENPVNRTKMLEMFLFVLFDLVELPTYGDKPDVKDCEYVLGDFCEKIIREAKYDFSKDEFIQKTKKFCEYKLLNLDIEILFRILYENHIIVDCDGQFRFKALYWIYYFAAQQMHINNDFYKFIIQDEGYIKFPEIIEFYTGINRDSVDMIKILINDLSKQCDVVEQKIGLPENFNLLDNMEWDPSKRQIKQIGYEINKTVQESNLPDAIKDEYEDKSYDSNRPYNQEVYKIVKGYTFLNLRQKISASSRALRNSDYIKPLLKKSLLQEITRGWGIYSKILFLLSPFMARDGYASFDGLGFILCGFEKLDFDEKINRIIQGNPTYVVKNFKDDLFSPKSAPLFYEAVISEKNKLIKHQLILLLIFTRPKEWSKYIEQYIKDVPKKSAYLLDILNLLINRYKYDFASNKEVSDMKNLLKMCYAKHELQGKYLTDESKQISNKVIPKRDM
ncbi:MAG: hypothetical protein HFP78_02615 [Methylococcales symbiont of Hymedesmia sp. n. MRB-2018]|nr:MAG: hypothetical protein HFP78_02615 [Methylococcales symbiont of Hymedesmia sp. n. MRB-2018]